MKSQKNNIPFLKFKKKNQFSLITADFVAMTILISMGAVLGKLTPVQYMMMSALEVPVAVAVEHFVLRYLKVFAFYLSTNEESVKFIQVIRFLKKNTK